MASQNAASPRDVRGYGVWLALLGKLPLMAARAQDALTHQRGPSPKCECLLGAAREEAHLATVYRAMPLLVDAGLVQATLATAGDSQQYEVVFEREQHHHVLCLECSRMVEFRSPALVALQREIATRHGFQLDGRASELHGRCKECRRSAPTPQARARN